MIRLLIVCLPLLVVPRGTALDLASTVAASRQARDSLTQRAQDLVRKRFALSAASADCRSVDNLYGYRLLLKQLPEPQKRLLRSAEIEGEDEGRSQAAARGGLMRACGAALAAVRAADDELVVMAEEASQSDATDR